jgi:hypothetical protein
MPDQILIARKSPSLSWESGRNTSKEVGNGIVAAIKILHI